MRNYNSLVMIGAAYLAIAASGASAQVDLGVEGAAREAGSVTQGRVGGAVDAAAGARVGVDGPTDAETVVGVQTALSQELRIEGIRSDVRDGVATLRGTVASEAEKQRAERIAKRVDGVTRVRNDLVVAGAANAAASAPGASVAGTSVESVVAGRIKSDPQLKARDIAVDTRKDVVTLTGQVESVAEKEAAGRIAADAAAGAEVRNQLTVRARD